MVSLTEVLEVNWIILYFVYGQVFFVTGLVTGLQWRRRSHLALAHPLPWLAAFGIAHGFNEWGYIFIPLQALYLDDAVVRIMIVAHLLLLAISFFFLFQFGVELVLLRLPKVRWLRAVPGLVLVIWAAIVVFRGTVTGEPLGVWFATGDALSRYLLCLPGAALACAGLLNQARGVRTMGLPRIANYLTGAALAFLVYAVVAGLVVPEAPFLPASVLNYTLLERTIRVPAAVFRSLCGLAMALFIFRSLEIFQVEDDRRIAEMEQEQILAEDRERIGRELHDGTIQSIYASGLGLEEAHHLVVENPPQAQRQIRAVMASLSRTIDDIRRYIFDLREADDTRELETVLAGLVQDLRLDTLLEVDLEVVGERCCWLSHEQVGHVTQVAREALSNIVQHADARRVKVRLSYEGMRTRLKVTDDGRGIRPDSRPDENGDSGGQGITNMRARAAMLGGTLDFADTPGGGLTLSLTVPCSDCGSIIPGVEIEEAWD